jgi:hypothetical protein
MTPEQVIRHYAPDGSDSLMRAAERAPVSRQSLNAWRKAGQVPRLWQVYIERDTAGRLKADSDVFENKRERVA